jgi:hypothetical protein
MEEEMNCYQNVISKLGLNTDSQGFHGNLFLMLKILSDYEDATPTADTYGNPYREVLHRLSAYDGTHAYREIAELFGVRAQDERV